MEFAVTAQIKNKPLFLAVQQMGSQVALAEHLGVAPSLIGSWLNLMNTPVLEGRHGKMWEKRIGQKLFALTGCTLKEIFPDEIRKDKTFLKLKKKFTKFIECDPKELGDAGFAPKQLPPPDKLLEQQELAERITQILPTLTPRESKVIKMRFGLGVTGAEHTLNEVAEHFTVTRERIRQIEAKALRKLRHPTRSRQLKPFIDGYDAKYERERELAREAEEEAEILESARNDERSNLRFYLRTQNCKFR